MEKVIRTCIEEKKLSGKLFDSHLFYGAEQKNEKVDDSFLYESKLNDEENIV